MEFPRFLQEHCSVLMRVFQGQALEVNTRPVNMFSQTWDFRSVLPSQFPPRYYSSFCFCLLSIVSFNPLFPSLPHGLSVCLSFPHTSCWSLSPSCQKIWKCRWILIMSARATWTVKTQNFTLRVPDYGPTRFPQPLSLPSSNLGCLPLVTRQWAGREDWVRRAAHLLSSNRLQGLVSPDPQAACWSLSQPFPLRPLS